MSRVVIILLLFACSVGAQTFSTGTIIRSGTFWGGTARVSEASEPEPPAGQAPCTNGLVAWYKADTITVGDGNAVSQWDDSSGTGNHIAQSVTARKPTYFASVINSLPAVLFNSANSNRLFTATPLGFGSESGQTIFAVVLVVSNTAGRAFVNTADTKYLLNFIPSSYEYQWPYIGGLAVGSEGANGPWTPHVLIGTYDSATQNASLYVSMIGTASGVKAGVDATTRISMGAYDADFGLLNAYIAEVLIYDREVTGNCYTDVRDYLVEKYVPEEN